MAGWLRGDEGTGGAWKAQLLEQGYRPVSVNAMLAAVNKLLVCMGREDCKVRYLRLQRQMFRKSERELTRAEYQRLLDAAQARGDIRLGSPLCYRYPCQRAAIHHRGGGAKRRGGNRPEGQDQNHSAAHEAVPQAAEIRQKVRHRPRADISDEKRKRAVPEVHLGGDEKLCEAAKVARSKVFPHNLRVLFARTFYAACRDVVRLADVLGHSSIETTRIYLLSTAKESARQLDRLGLLSGWA